MIEKYSANNVEFKDAWKLVTEKVPTQIVKELALAIEKFYTFRPHRLESQHSPHHIAAERGSLSLCKFIARKTKSLNPARADGMTALHFAVQEGHFDVCKYFVDNLDGDKNPANHDGRTPLHEAAFQGNLAVLKHIADQVAHWHIQIVKYIMDVIDDKNQNDLKGQTPMHLAVQKGDYEMCKVIINCGADPNPTDNEGISALDLADSKQEIRDLILKTLVKI